VSVTNRRPTESSPPTVEITVTNDSESPQELGIEGGTSDNRFPFTYKKAGDQEDGLVLNASGTFGSRTGCWSASTVTVLNPNPSRTWTFQPGESYTADRAIRTYVDPDSTSTPNDCWPTGTFAFVESYGFKWGFWVHVDEQPSISVREMQPFEE
jgi:hypothetical protein